MRRFAGTGRSRTPAVALPCLLLAVVVTVGLLSSGCGGGTPTQTTTPAADVLRLANATEFAGGWDPRASGGNEVTYLANMYETLLRANPAGSTEPFEPVLATSWKVSSDGLEWTFTLRQGVKFHDGQPFNADAVKYSIDATKELGQGVAYILDSIKSVEVVDAYTVKFVLSDPVPLDRILSAEYAAYMFSPATKGQKSEWWVGKDYGTGPYTLTTSKPGEQYVFARYADYWGGWKDSQYKQVVVNIVQEAGTQRQMLEGGEVDFTYQVARDSVSALKQNTDLTVHEVPSQIQYNVVFNTLRAPLNNVKVRQALAYAIPYDDVITVGVNGFANKSSGMVPKGLFPYNPDLAKYTTDLDKAKALLAEAGYPNGTGIHKLRLVYWSDSAGAVYEKAAPLIKEAWAKLGVTVDVQPMLSSQGYAMATGAESQRQDVILDKQWPSFPDGEDMLWYQWHSQEVSYNWSYWSSKETDKLMDDAFALESTDLTKAKELYDQCQTLLVENVPCAPLFDYIDIYASRAAVTLQDGALNTNYPLVLRWRLVSPATSGS
jgi:peptide/nickel transport system substrate-binding protein